MIKFLMIYGTLCHLKLTTERLNTNHHNHHQIVTFSLLFSPQPSRKLSAAALRKISTISQASNSSNMSSLSQKVDFNADSFTDAIRGMLDLGLGDEDWSDDESSGMSSYGDEDGSPALEELISEDAEQGGREDMRKVMQDMDDELRDSTLAESFVKATKAVRKEVSFGVVFA